MKTLRRQRILLPVILFAFIFSAKAQNTNSAYSRYGYGVLKDPAVGASKGMGGISYALRGQNVNPGNPASYAAVDSLTFLFDISISFTQSRFKTPNANQNDDNGGLDYLALEFPIAKRLAISAGFLPYSSVGYSFGGIVNEGEISQSQSVFSGSGGLNQIYGGLAYRLFDNLSVGANVAYLYGDLEHLRTNVFSESTHASTSELKRLSVNAAKMDFGLQYQQLLKIAGRPHLLTLGAVYSPSVKPSAKTSVISEDTLTYKGNVQLPNTFGAGFTLANKNWLYGADITFQKWAELDYPAEMEDGLTAADKRFNDRIRINAGGEFVIDPYDRSFFKRIKFRGGVNYSNSYLNVKENATGKVGGFSEYGATLGFALPFRDNTYTGRTSYVNINFEYVKLRPEVKSMISEDYFSISIGLSLNDLWFMKNKFR
ncbi:MAG: hypothetical protein LBR34_04305 [Prevotella sp.]|jgi:hypothetical protein|nr:hypothetical protein [Prevotella sp.]